MNTIDKILSARTAIPRRRDLATIELYCYPFSQMTEEVCAGLDAEIGSPSDYSDPSEYSDYHLLAAQRRLYVRDHIQRRACGGISQGAVRDRALERHFLLINAELRLMDNLLTEAEFVLLLKVFRQSVIRNVTVQGLEYEFFLEYECLIELMPTMAPEASAASVAAKLGSLSLTQRFALADVLERCNRTECSCVTDNAERNGLRLASNITKGSA